VVKLDDQQVKTHLRAAEKLLDIDPARDIGLLQEQHKIQLAQAHSLQAIAILLRTWVEFHE
jgi:hypothetical protein